MIRLREISRLEDTTRCKYRILNMSKNPTFCPLQKVKRPEYVIYPDVHREEGRLFMRKMKEDKWYTSFAQGQFNTNSTLGQNAWSLTYSYEYRIRHGVNIFLNREKLDWKVKAYE